VNNGTFGDPNRSGVEAALTDLRPRAGRSVHTRGREPTRADQLESRSISISAVAELSAEKGFCNTTFVDIAERSGISRGSIPWHFGNKAGLLKAVVEELTTNMLTDAATPGGHRCGHARLGSTSRASHRS
jgi:hypothetical protein